MNDTPRSAGLAWGVLGALSALRSGLLEMGEGSSALLVAAALACAARARAFFMSALSTCTVVKSSAMSTGSLLPVSSS